MRKTQAQQHHIQNASTNMIYTQNMNMINVALANIPAGKQFLIETEKLVKCLPYSGLFRIFRIKEHHKKIKLRKYSTAIDSTSLS